MKYCQHEIGNSRKGSKRHKRETEDKQPDYAVLLSEGEKDNDKDPQVAEDEKNESTEALNEGAVEEDNEDPGEVDNGEAVERVNEEAVDVNIDEAVEDDQAMEGNDEEAVEGDNNEAVEGDNDEAVEENNEDAVEDDRAMEGNNEGAVEENNEEAVDDNNEEAMDENDEDAVEENNEEDVQGDNEVAGEGENEIDVQEDKGDNKQEDEKKLKKIDINGKTVLNFDDEEPQIGEGESLEKENRENDSERSKDISDLAADYDQITEDADLDQNEKDCPSVCAARDVMVCAKCQHNIYRTFMSPCHLRLFNCKYPDEKLQLVSRQPCMQSAPFLTDLPGAQGRISEPGDQDSVLKFIHCRDKGKLDDPRCKFDR
ncbi:uncharacterized protein DDB_G0290685-like [Vanessa cardui]|uniref:uncharacterized protein DDB_G0290685-like n=1 Tax=Vanessa cardui TaxID=171605 RepID=UPI001F130510|nr:uncharacterized protein DDB_G0290685-like [Vanessa cardui]